MRILKLAAVAALCLATAQGWADTYYWIGGDNGNWRDASNWSTTEDDTGVCSSYPDAAEKLVFPSSANTIFVTNSVATSKATSIEFNSTVELTGSKQIQLHNASGTGRLVLSSATLYPPENNSNLYFNVNIELKSGTANTIYVPHANKTSNSSNAYIYFQEGYGIYGTGKLTFDYNSHKNNGVFFYGDNRNFGGVIEQSRLASADRDNVGFTSGNSTSQDASWMLKYSNSRTWKTNNDTYYFGAFHGSLKTSATGITFEIGNRDSEVSDINGAVNSATINKVGANVLTNKCTGVGTVNIKNGGVVFAAITSIPANGINFEGTSGSIVLSDSDSSLNESVLGAIGTVPSTASVGLLAETDIELNVYNLKTVLAGKKLAKRGSGTLTLTSATGAEWSDLIVEEGTLIIPYGVSFGAVTVSEGASLLVDLTGASAGTVFSCTSRSGSIAVKEGTQEDGTTLNDTATANTWTIERATKVFTWNSNIEGASWETPENWLVSVGGAEATTATSIPTTADNIYFNASAKVSISENSTVGNVVVADGVTLNITASTIFTKLALGTGSYLQLDTSSTPITAIDGEYRLMTILDDDTEVTTSDKIIVPTIYSVGIASGVFTATRIASTANAPFVWSNATGDGYYSSAGNWKVGDIAVWEIPTETDYALIPSTAAEDTITSSSGSGYVYTGNLTIEKSITLTGNYYLNKIDGSATLTVASVALSKSSGSFEIDCPLEVTGTLTNPSSGTGGDGLTIKGTLTGSGTIACGSGRAYCVFKGVTTGFKGTYACGTNAYQNSRDYTQFSDLARGSSDATWQFDHYNTYPFRESNTTYYFGQLNANGTSGGFQIKPATSSVIEVGGLADKTSDVNGTIGDNSNMFKKVGESSIVNLTLTESKGTIEVKAGRLNLLGTFAPAAVKLTGAQAELVVDPEINITPTLSEELIEAGNTLAVAGNEGGMKTYTVSAIAKIGNKKYTSIAAAMTDVGDKEEMTAVVLRILARPKLSDPINIPNNVALEIHDPLNVIQDSRITTGIGASYSFALDAEDTLLGAELTRELTMSGISYPNSANVAGSLEVLTGGKITYSGTFAVGVGSNASGTLIVDGGSIAKSADGAEFVIGKGAGATANVHIKSGSVTVGGNKGILLGDTASGGEVTVTIGGGESEATFLSGAAGLRFCRQNDDKSQTVTLKPNGVLTVAYIQADKTPASGSAAKLVFDGGTLQARGDNSDWLKTQNSMQYVIAAGGAIIDTNGKTVTAVNTFSADDGVDAPTLTKRGSGALTLTAAEVPSGFILAVEAGTVVMPATLKASVTLSERTYISDDGEVNTTYSPAVAAVDGVGYSTYALAVAAYETAAVKTIKAFSASAERPEGWNFSVDENGDTVLINDTAKWKIGSAYYTTLAAAFAVDKDGSQLIRNDGMTSTESDENITIGEGEKLWIRSDGNFNGRVTLDGGQISVDNSSSASKFVGGVTVPAGKTGAFYFSKGETPNLPTLYGSGTLVIEVGGSSGFRINNPSFVENFEGGTIVINATSEKTSGKVYGFNQYNANSNIDLSKCNVVIDPTWTDVATATAALSMEIKNSKTLTLRSLTVTNQYAQIENSGGMTLALSGNEDSVLNNPFSASMTISKTGTGKLIIGSGFSLGGDGTKTINVTDGALEADGVVDLSSGYTISLSSDVEVTVAGEGSSLTLPLGTTGYVCGKHTKVDTTVEDAVKFIYYIATDSTIKPSEESTTTYATEAAATEAAQGTDIAIDTAVADELDEKGISEETYKGYFEVKPVEKSAGNWVVSVDYTTAIDAELHEDIDTAFVDATIATGEGGSEITIDTLPGLYYAIEAGDNPTSLTAGEATMATEETKTLTFTLPDSGVKYYKVKVSPTP